MMELRSALSSVFAAYVLSSAPLRVAAQSSASCSAVTVTGGVSPGSYVSAGTELDGKLSYEQLDGGEVVAVLRFVEDSLRRGRELAEGEEYTEMDRFLAASGAAEALEKRREDDAADGARQAAGESKAECATGFWLNSVGAGTSSSTENITYPVYIVNDCADHPADITAEWISLSCATCEQVVPSTEVSIVCDDSTDASDSSSSGTGVYDCGEITVSEGAFTGAYEYSAQIDGKFFYGNTSVGIGFFDISELVRRRRGLLEAEEGGEDGGLESLAHSVAKLGNVGNTLEACTTGVWYIREMVDVTPIVYPIYISPDCAAHPLEITSAWVVIEDDENIPVATSQPVLECTNFQDIVIEDETPNSAAMTGGSVSRVGLGVAMSLMALYVAIVFL